MLIISSVGKSTKKSKIFCRFFFGNPEKKSVSLPPQTERDPGERGDEERGVSIVSERVL